MYLMFLISMLFPSSIPNTTMDSSFSPLLVKDTSILYDTTSVDLTTFDLYKLLNLKNSYQYMLRKNMLLRDELKLKDRQILSFKDLVKQDEEHISLLDSRINLKDKEIKINTRKGRLKQLGVGLGSAGGGILIGIIIALFAIK